MACERCEGTGFVITTREGKEFAQPCSCRRSGAAEAGARRLAGARIPLRYEHCVLTNFDAVQSSLRAAHERALSYAAGFPHLGSEEGLGLLFTGNSGSARPTSRWPCSRSSPSARESAGSSGTSRS